MAAIRAMAPWSVLNAEAHREFLNNVVSDALYEFRSEIADVAREGAEEAIPARFGS